MAWGLRWRPPSRAGGTAGQAQLRILRAQQRKGSFPPRVHALRRNLRSLAGWDGDPEANGVFVVSPDGGLESGPALQVFRRPPTGSGVRSRCATVGHPAWV